MKTRVRKTTGSRNGNGDRAPGRIRDIGGIVDFEFKIPKSGVVVFRGKNSVGKTTALNTLESLSTGRKLKLVEHRDGATAGDAEAVGVRLTVGRSAKRTGQLEVYSLDSRFSILDVVEPGISDPESADRKRIKALIQLVGAKPDLDLFRPLLVGPASDLEPEEQRAANEEFDEIITTATRESDDLVAMAARVKADIEARARKLEDEEKKALTRAESEREAAGYLRYKLAGCQLFCKLWIHA